MGKEDNYMTHPPGRDGLTQKFYCSLPTIPWKNDESDTPHFTPYPVKPELVGDNVKMECNGKGFWHTDYITKEEYCTLEPGEQCHFSCNDALFVPTDGSFSCDNNGFLSGFLPERYLPIKCEQNFCIIPSFGKGWYDQYDEENETRVQMGVQCSGNNTLNNEDHSIVEMNAECKFVCRVDNGHSYRTNSDQKPIKCLRNIPSYKFEGCDKDNCVDDFIREGLDLLGDLPDMYNLQNVMSGREWVTDWNAPGRYPPWKERPRIKVPGLVQLRDDEKFNVCYRVKDETCPELKRTEDDIKNHIVINCSDSNNPASKCVKECAAGYIALSAEKTDTITCKCTDTCAYDRDFVDFTCVKASCSLPEEVETWPKDTKCYDKDNILLDRHNPETEYPPGSFCKQECVGPYYRELDDYYGSGTYETKCNCDDAGNCSFSYKRISPCERRVCSST